MRKSSVITIRRSPIVIVRNFLALEVVGYAAFIAAGAAADYGELYNRLSISQVVSYHVVEITGIVLIELVITAFIFARWFYEYYQLRSDSLLIAKGLLLRRKRAIPLERIASVDHEYGILGRIFGYGTLVL